MCLAVAVGLHHPAAASGWAACSAVAKKSLQVWCRLVRMMSRG